MNIFDIGLLKSKVEILSGVIWAKFDMYQLLLCVFKLDKKWKLKHLKRSLWNGSTKYGAHEIFSIKHGAHGILSVEHRAH